MTRGCEVWADIEGCEGIYQVSNFGRVRSLDRLVMSKNRSNQRRKGKIMKLSFNNYGYHVVNLSTHRKMVPQKVHRLVASAFLKRTGDRNHIDHINRVRHDNRVSNLRWVSQAENNENQIYRRGESRSKKLKNIDILHIRDEYDRLCVKNKFGALKLLSRGYGMSGTCIFHIVNKITWRHV